MLNVYVAAPYVQAERVRKVHRAMESLGLTPVSSWAECAYGPEQLDSLPVQAIRANARANDEDLCSAHVLLVWAFEGQGKEMFAEAERARICGIPTVWVGAPAMGAFRPGVVRAESIEEALIAIAFFAEEVPVSTPEMTRIRIRGEFQGLFA